MKRDCQWLLLFPIVEGIVKKNEILKLVAAYQDMQKFYIPKAKELEYDIDYKDFSKFAELQNKGIIDCLKVNGFTKEDFAGWVLNGNVDTAQNVRLLPTIFKEKSSKAEFLKSNISEAYKKVSVATSPLDLSSVDCYDLSKVLTTKLDKLEWKEVLQIRSDKGEDKRAILSKLEETIKLILENDAEDY